MTNLATISDAEVVEQLSQARSRVADVFDPAEVTAEGVKALAKLHALVEEGFRRGVIEVKQGL